MAPNIAATATEWVLAASANEVAEGTIVGLVVNGREIALYHVTGGEFLATSNICTHGQAYLSDGWLVDDCRVECPLHGGCFDIRSGKAVGPPVDEELQTYAVRREGDDIFIAVPS